MARETSIRAYRQIVEEGLLGKLQCEVVKCFIDHGQMTQGECAIFHFPSRQRHSIAPRFAELERMGVIECVGRRNCEVTGREAQLYDLTDRLPDRSKLDRDPQSTPKKILAAQVEYFRKSFTDLENYFRRKHDERLAELIRKRAIEIEQMRGTDGIREDKDETDRRVPKAKTNVDANRAKMARHPLH